MPIANYLLSSFQEQSFYHVICKSISGKKLFLNDENKRYFLERYQYFLNDYLETYAFCLLDNHVHWLIKIKSAAEIVDFLKTMSIERQTITHKKFLQKECDFHELIEQQFNRLFIGYSLALNKKHDVKGHLFHRPFRRICIADDMHLTQLYVYIHANPLKHGITKDFFTFKWSSYQAILSNSATNIQREKVLDWFGDREQFINAHKEMAAFFYEHELGGD